MVGGYQMVDFSEFKPTAEQMKAQGGKSYDCEHIIQKYDLASFVDNRSKNKRIIGKFNLDDFSYFAEGIVNYNDYVGIQFTVGYVESGLRSAYTIYAYLSFEHNQITFYETETEI